MSRMKICPFCRSPLAPSEIQEKLCLSCGKLLNSAEAPTELGKTKLSPSSMDIVTEEEESPEQASSVTAPTKLRPPKKSNRQNAPSGKARPKESPEKNVDEAKLRASIQEIWSEVVQPETADSDTLRSRGTGFSGDVPPSASLLIKPRSLGNRKIDKDDTATHELLDYELLETLGEGGMGVVYRARQTAVNRTIALKMLKPGMEADSELRSQFLLEAAVTGKLDHPNIIPIYDLGSHDSGGVFYAMKCVHGELWSNSIRDKHVPENLDILMRVSDAIAFAHSRGVIHRDLKPGNIMLGPFGEVLVVDWGLAMIPKDAQRLQESSRNLGGTPAYMAPEMASGNLSEIGLQTDVYLLGAILFEIIAGYPPHRSGSTMETLFSVALNRIRPTDAQGELLDIAYKAMETAPSNRYESVLEFQNAIRSYQQHSESMRLLAQAQDDFFHANQAKDYDLFSQAIFAYREAIKLWSENETAHRALEDAEFALAKLAFKQGDYDLALSWLDKEKPEHCTLYDEVHQQKEERDLRQLRYMATKRITQALGVILIIVLMIATFLIRQEQVAARNAATLAEVQRQKAEDTAQDLSLSNAQLEEANNQLEDANQQLARTNEQLATKTEEAQSNAMRAERNAERAERNATQAEKNALIAEENEEKAQLEAYTAKMSLADSQIQSQAFGQARRQLATLRPEDRGWEYYRLDYLTHLSERVWNAGSAPLQALNYSERLKVFVTTGQEETASLWSLTSKDPVHSFQSKGGTIWTAAFHPEQPVLALGQANGSVSFWSPQSGRYLGELPQQSGEVLSLCFNRKGDQLVTGSSTGDLRLWMLPENPPLSDKFPDSIPRISFGIHHDGIWSVAFSPDGKNFVSASQDGEIRLWDIQPPSAEKSFPQFRPQVTKKANTQAVYRAVYSASGEWIATAGGVNEVKIWPSNLSTPAKVIKTNSGKIDALSFSFDGSQVITGGRNNVLQIWDRVSGKLLKTLRGHAEPITDLQIISTEEGEKILSASRDRTARLWNPETYSEEVSHDTDHSEVLSVDFQKDEAIMATGGQDRAAKLWAMESGELLATLRQGHQGKVINTCVSPHQDYVATCGEDGTVRLWDRDKGTELYVFQGHDQPVHGLDFNPEGSQLVSAGEDGRIIVWDILQGTKVKEWTLPPRRILCLKVSPDGKQLLTGDHQGEVVLWELATGKELLRFTKHVEAVVQVDFSKDQTRAHSASEDHVVSEWKLADGKEIQTFSHPCGVLAFAFSEDASQLVTGAEDGMVRVWDTKKGQQIKEWKAHSESIVDLDFASDSGRIVTASPDATVREWSIETKKQLAEYRGYQSFVWSVQYLKDSDLVLTCGDQQAQLWKAGEKTPSQRFSSQGAISGVAFGPGSLLATASWDGSILLWDRQSERPIRRLPQNRDHQPLPDYRWNKVNWDLDNNRLAAVCDQGRLLVWDAGDGSLILDEKLSNDRLREVIFSPDGESLLIAGNERSLIAWDLRANRSIRIPSAHRGPIIHLRFSKSGEEVLSAGLDNVAKRWSFPSLELQQQYLGHSAGLTSASFLESPTNPISRVLTASADRTVKIWEIDSGNELLTLRGHRGEVLGASLLRTSGGLVTIDQSGEWIAWPIAVPAE
ncbi:Hypothetical protein PBC10988_37440 [Planctomycetales bacterium 10988]|nr:Hypothetical protein PBC10988_37440 [Planctomycetales bacterium 10988]